MKARKHIITRVISDTIADELGLESGDSLMEINGQQVEDALDYHLLILEQQLEVLIEKQNGEEWLLDIEKDENEDLGLVFENNLMDDYKCCTNKCIFCFIDQLPKGMRKTLYFKDDDARLSFLQGNYVTLTNMRDKDIERIIKYHLSPINLSVHTMNMKLRKMMLKNPLAEKLIEGMDKLYDARITMNGQIVLCKGINDKEELDYSIEQLTNYIPHMQSVSIVPVGLSKHRKGLYPLEPFTSEEARGVLNQIHQWQKKIYDQYGTHLIHAGDEFYLLAHADFPMAESYDGYLQLENGVGMCRLLIDEVKSYLSALEGHTKEKNITMITGELASRLIHPLVDLLKNQFPNVVVQVVPIHNSFFGSNITVSGLLTGRDIIEQLKGKKLGDRLLMPCNLLKHDETVLLDDITIEDIERALQVKVRIVQSSGQDFVEAIIE